MKTMWFQISARYQNLSNRFTKASLLCCMLTTKNKLSACFLLSFHFQLSLLLHMYYSGTMSITKKTKGTKKKRTGVSCSENKYESHFKQSINRSYCYQISLLLTDIFHCKKFFFVTVDMFPTPLLERQIQMPVLNFWTRSDFSLTSLQQCSTLFFAVYYCYHNQVLLNTKVVQKHYHS